MSADTETEPEGPRAGRVAIVGRPNVGKSTLLNALLGQKLVITTPKPGTTRSCVLGVFVAPEPPTQIAFIDTPGFERPRSVLGRVLMEEAQGSLEEADAVLFLVDGSKLGPHKAPLAAEDEAILTQLRAAEKPVVLALNKVDKLRDKTVLLPRLAALGARDDLGPGAPVPMSALKRDNLRPLLAELRQHLPEGLLYEDDDFLTDKPERFFAAELVREAVLRNTQKEVPYSVAVRIEEYRDDGPRVRIGAQLLVEKDSQKGILIGAKGSMLKTIGTSAREGIEAFLGRPVYLRLWVKVLESWTRDPRKVRELTREPGG